MCDTDFPDMPAGDEGWQLLEEAATYVVATMSESTLRNLFQEMVTQMLSDAGDASDLPMFERVVLACDNPSPYYKLHKVQVRATCAAAAAVCAMLMGPDRNEQAARLAIATILQREFSETIH